MQKILIIGNGFDLHHNLPTKYEHFINVLKAIEYIKEEQQEEYLFEEVFSNIKEDFKTLIKNSYQTENIKFTNHDIINIIKRHVIHNSWYQTFKHITEIDNWIDFEMQIKNILQIVNQFILEFNKFIKVNYGKTFIEVSIQEMNNPFGFKIDSYHFRILRDLNIIETKSFKGSIGNIPSVYYLKENNSIYAINEKKVFEYLATSLEHFIHIFNLYFTTIIEPFYQNYNNLEIIKDSQSRNCLLQNTDSGFEQFIHEEEKFTAIYSFNYTPTLHKYYKTSMIKYLHGKSCDFQNMVLGIDDNNDELKDPKLFAFTKYYQKLYKNTDYDFMEKHISTDCITHIYIWGHSLDYSDGEYINQIFKFLEMDERDFKLIIFYHDNTARASQIQNLLNICGKQVIEKSMKSGQLTFQPSTNENLLKMVQIA